MPFHVGETQPTISHRNAARTERQTKKGAPIAFFEPVIHFSPAIPFIASLPQALADFSWLAITSLESCRKNSLRAGPLRRFPKLCRTCALLAIDVQAHYFGAPREREISFGRGNDDGFA
jgi:hypothetical protein